MYSRADLCNVHSSVRRSDLYSPPSSTSSSPDPSASARLQSFFQDFDNASSPQQVSQPIVTSQSPPPAESPTSSGYAFRLFARKSDPKDRSLSTKQDVESSTKQPTSTENSVSHVILRSPTPENQEPGFVQPHRRRDYYFTGVISAEEKARFNQTALSGQDVLAQLHVRWVRPLRRPTSFLHGVHYRAYFCYIHMSHNPPYEYNKLTRHKLEAWSNPPMAHNHESPIASSTTTR